MLCNNANLSSLLSISYKIHLSISLSDKIPNALNNTNNGISVRQCGILTLNVLPF